MPILGLDLGTQSLKAVVLSDALEPLGSGSSPYQPSFPRPGWAEQDPALWLAALQPAIGAALAEARLAPNDVAAVALCGQLDGCVATDAAGAPLAPALLWMDRRAEALLAGIDPEMIRDRCGLVLDATHMGAKIAWLAGNLSPAAIRTWHQPVSFVVAALTGVSVMAHSLASTTMLYNVRDGGWDDDLLARFACRSDQLPALGREADIAGTLTPSGAALTGLSVGLPVAVGTGDDFSNLIGCGISLPGLVGVSLGTAEAVGALADTPVIDPEMLVETHAFPGGGFHLGNPGWLSGGAVRWAAELLRLDSDAALSALAAEAPAGCDGLVFIPALTGAMAPRWIAPARGSFVGLTASHGPAHLARAVLEGTAFAMRDVVDRLAAVGVRTDRLRLMGGGARSDLWCQIRADLTDRPVEALVAGDASATGAGVLAAVAAGLAPDIATASAALHLPLRLVEPGADRSAYASSYAAYRDTFEALAPLWERPKG